MSAQPDPHAERLAQVHSRFAERWIEVSRIDMQWLLLEVDRLNADRDRARAYAVRAQAEGFLIDPRDLMRMLDGSAL